MSRMLEDSVDVLYVFSHFVETIPENQTATDTRQRIWLTNSSPHHTPIQKSLINCKVVTFDAISLPRWSAFATQNSDFFLSLKYFFPKLIFYNALISCFKLASQEPKCHRVRVATEFWNSSLSKLSSATAEKDSLLSKTLPQFPVSVPPPEKLGVEVGLYFWALCAYDLLSFSQLLW